MNAHKIEDYLNGAIEIPQEEPRQGRDNAINLPWNNTAFAALFAYAKLSRAVCNDGVNLGIYPRQAIIEIGDAICYLARAYALDQEIDDGADEDYGLDAAFAEAVEWVSQQSALHGAITNKWDEPGSCLLAAYATLKSYKDEIRIDVGVVPNELIEAIPMIIARLARAGVLLEEQRIFVGVDFATSGHDETVIATATDPTPDPSPSHEERERSQESDPTPDPSLSHEEGEKASEKFSDFLFEFKKYTGIELESLYSSSKEIPPPCDFCDGMLRQIKLHDKDEKRLEVENKRLKKELEEERRKRIDEIYGPNYELCAGGDDDPVGARHAVPETDFDLGDKVRVIRNGKEGTIAVLTDVGYLVRFEDLDGLHTYRGDSLELIERNSEPEKTHLNFAANIALAEEDNQPSPQPSPGGRGNDNRDPANELLLVGDHVRILKTTDLGFIESIDEEGCVVRNELTGSRCKYMPHELVRIGRQGQPSPQPSPGGRGGENPEPTESNNKPGLNWVPEIG